MPAARAAPASARSARSLASSSVSVGAPHPGRQRGLEALDAVLQFGGLEVETADPVPELPRRGRVEGPEQPNQLLDLRPWTVRRQVARPLPPARRRAAPPWYVLLCWRFRR